MWSEIAAALADVKSVWEGEAEVEVKEKLQSVTRALFSPIATQLGWTFADGEGHLIHLLRTLAISVSGKAGYGNCLSQIALISSLSFMPIVEHARKLFSEFVSRNSIDVIHPNLRGAVLSMVLKYGGEVEWESVLTLYGSTRAADQKVFHAILVTSR